jgi:monoamine oxidase
MTTRRSRTSGNTRDTRRSMKTPSLETETQFVVIGAGLAGLAAADWLKQEGYRVIVLESRSTPGGRVQTFKGDFADDLYADAGAMVFGDSQKLLMGYVDRFQLPYLSAPVKKERTLYFERGHGLVASGGIVRPIPPGLSREERRLGADGLLEKYFVDGILDGHLMSPLDEKWPPQELQRYDKITGLEFLHRRGASAEAIELLEQGLLGLTGEGFSSTSALSLLAIVAFLLPMRNEIWLKGGSEALPRALSRVLSQDIKYAASVSDIRQMGKHVVVTYDKGAREHVVVADYVISTVPFRFLKDIVFTPPLASSKDELIHCLLYTSVTRVFLQFSERFWTRGTVSPTIETDLPIMSLLSACPTAEGRGILESYTTGRHARDLGRMTSPERVRIVLDDVAKVYPQAPSLFEGGTSKSWDDDDYVAGAYLYFRPGQLVELRDTLTEPHGRAHFAGDQTTPLPGWAEAALHSGLRAARQVARHL